MQGSHLTVFSAGIPRQRNSLLQQKGKTVVTNIVREAVSMCCSISNMTFKFSEL